MAENEPEWLVLAKDVYRTAQSELLEKWRGMQTGLIDAFREDLREALLDLKQAVIEGRAADAASYMHEVTSLLIELRRRSLEG